MTAINRLTAALSDRYRLERELGQGGMATVYLALDLKHERKVAIKVLKPELAAVLGAERFLQEIKTTAALQHPHILPLHDSGTADGFLYYVMPFIDGETLRGKLDRETQLGIDDAVQIARDVASALHYAHEHGVIHRDIKPENILLHEGRPMVADFGIALALSAAAGGRMTETGMSLGTPHYMSPEQATAEKEISARSDVYSLASVLYEMLTGQPPHLGGSAQQIIMKIVTDTARPVAELRKSVPPNVAAAVAKALEKLPADRFASARAFVDALANPAFTTAAAAALAQPGGAAVRVFGRTVAWRAIAAGLGVALVGSVAWALTRGGGGPGAAPVVRAELDILTRSDSGVWVNGVDISPDGSMIVYSAEAPGSDAKSKLYLRRLEDRVARLIPGTEGAEYPTFAPDGQSIAFVFDNKSIRRIPITGVVTETVLHAPEAEGIWALHWASDGYIYYDDDTGTGLNRVPERGGPAESILSTRDPEPWGVLPGGRHLLYTECCSPTSEVMAVEVATGETRSLGIQARSARYISTGHLLLDTDDALKAVAFDARSLEVRGEPIPVLDSVTANGSVRDFALSRNGTAVYTVRPRGTGAGSARLGIVDLAGNEQVLPLPEAEYSEMRFSPDGRRIVAATRAAGGATGSNLLVHDLVVGTTTRRIFPHDVGDPIWTGDGARIIFVGHPEADGVVSYVGSVLADGTGTVDTLIVGSADIYFAPALTPNGTTLLLSQASRLGTNLVTLRLDDSTRRVATYLGAEWTERHGVVSPDGRWAAYISDEEREAGPGSPPLRRVYVRSFPEPGERFVVSDSAGESPRWSRDGRTIFYWRGRTTLVAASVRTTPSFAVTSRRDLFTRTDADPYSWDVHPDGGRFIMVLESAAIADGAVALDLASTRLVVVVNWLEEFKRKVGVRR